MSLRHIGHLGNLAPQSLEVCNEMTIVKIIAIKCKSGRGEKLNLSMSSAHHVPTAEGPVPWIRYTNRADL